MSVEISNYPYKYLDMSMQTTIKRSFSLSGVTLHSGLISTVSAHPSPANTGIRFKRIDLDISDHQKIIDCSVRNISSSKLCTILKNKYGHKISTVEHLMSSLHGLGIDNVLIDINTDEIPILDGSSKLFVEAIEDVGVKQLNSERKIIKILNPLIVRNKDAFIKITPSDFFSIDYTISYNHKLINEQKFKLEYLNEIKYKELISSSRTFGFAYEVNLLREQGLIKGGSIDNAIVLSEDGTLNNEELRFNDEFVRHKILDAIGDLYILGFPIIGHIEAYCAGHSLMHDALRSLLQDKSLWQIIKSSEVGHKAITYHNKEILSYI